MLTVLQENENEISGMGYAAHRIPVRNILIDASRRLLALTLSLLVLAGPETLLAANYQWVQTDWSGGGDTQNTTGHDPTQNGQTLWNRYYAKDPNLSTPTGQLSLSPLIASWTQTMDTDFNSGTRTNLQVVNSGELASLRISDFVLDRGTGSNGGLVVDGTTPSSSTDGIAHGPTNPLILDGIWNYTTVTVQNGGVISTSPAILLSSPTTVSIIRTPGVNGPDGIFYYVVTAVDASGFETYRSPSADDPYQNKIDISGFFAPQISWSPVAGASGYRVYRKTDPTSSYNVSPYSSPSLVCAISNPSVTTCLDTLATPAPGAPHLKFLPTPTSVTVSASGGALPDGVYYYAITAVDYWGFETTRGTQAAATVSAGTGTAAVTITWGANGEATGFRVYRSTQSGIFNDPALVCSTTMTTCTDTLSSPLPWAPPRSYYHAIAGGRLHLKVQGGISLDPTSSILVNGKGFPGGTDTVSSTQGAPGNGPGAAGNRGGGGGYGTAGGSNSGSPAFPAEVGIPYGSPVTTSALYPGSGGAAGSFTSTTSRGGTGGAGGGAIRIAADTIALSGSLLAHGNTGQDTNITRTDPGGGGSGGLIILEGNTIALNGQIMARGGPGGKFTGTGGRTPSYYATGGSGGDGRIRLAPGILPITGTGTVNPPAFVGDIGIYEGPSQDLGVGGARFTGQTLAWTGRLNGGTLKFLIATNKDNQTWVYRGPDGTLEGSANPTYYTASGTFLFGGHDGDRYIRYKVLFEAPDTDPIHSPLLDSVTIGYEYHPALQSLTSSPFDTGDVTNVPRRLSWEETLSAPGAMDIALQMRTADSKGTLPTSSWKGPFDTTLASLSLPVQDPGMESCTSIYTTPPGWTASAGTTTSGCFPSGHSGSWSVRGVRALYFYQALTLSAGVNYVFSVWVKADPGQSATLRVSGTPAGGTIYCSRTTNSVAFTQLSCPYTPPGSQTVYLALQSGNDTASMAWFDDVAVSIPGTGGLNVIAVNDVTGFRVGDTVTIADSITPAQEELRQVSAIDTLYQQLTLDTPLIYGYANGSVITNTYTDPQGQVAVNASQRDGVNDQWFQYRAFLTTSNRLNSPVLLENRVGYLPAAGILQPDGIIDGNIDGLPYGGPGSGAGGSSSRTLDPGFTGGEARYALQIQNDGTSSGGRDTYTLSLNPTTLSDISGPWTIRLINGNQEFAFPATVSLDPGGFQDYTLKVLPPSHAPADSTQTIILDIRSENEYAKIDSVQAVATVNRIYQADGIIGIVNPDGSISSETGDGPPFDPNHTGHDPSGQGNGGNASQSAVPGDAVSYSIKIENEGNIPDRYTFSHNTSCIDSKDPNFVRPLPTGWKIFFNDGVTDYDITSASVALPPSTAPAIPATVDPNNISFKRFTLKVLPVGDPITCTTLLTVASPKGDTTTPPVLFPLDSLKATTVLIGTHKIDLWIEGTHGDNDYVLDGTGNDGSYSKGIPGGTTGTFQIGVQNEGNVPDHFELSWGTPSGWSIALLHQDGSLLCSASPCVVPPSDKNCPYYEDRNLNGRLDIPGDQCLAIPGEVLPLNLRIKPPDTFMAGEQGVVINGESLGARALGEMDKVDSVRAQVWANAVNIAVTSVTATTATISWSAPAWSANGYDLRYSTREIIEDGLFAGPGQVNFSNALQVRGLSRPNAAGTLESMTVTQLYANTSYYFSLKTKFDAGYTSVLSTCSNCPAQTAVSSDAISPAAVGDLEVTTATADSITLCWTAPADDDASTPVTGYLVKYSTRRLVDDVSILGMGDVSFTDAVSASGLGVPKSPGSRECYKVLVENKVSSNDRTPNSQFFFRVASEDENHNLSPASNRVQGLTALQSNSYNMISIPKVPSGSPVNVFGNVSSPPRYTELYLYQWDSRGAGHDTGCYDGWPSPYNPNNVSPNCMQITSIREGMGYFLWSPRLDVVLVPTGFSDVPAASCTDESGQPFLCYQLPLQEGWNMIGNPFGREVTVNSLKVREMTAQGGVATVTFLQAVNSRGWMGNALYTHNGTNYTYETCDTTQCLMVLQPWKSYWLWLHNSGGIGTSYELMIPMPQPQ